MAISYEPELLLARDQGLKLVSIGALVQRPLTSIIALPGKHVRERRGSRGQDGRHGRASPIRQPSCSTALQAAGVDPARVHGSQRRLQPRAGDALGQGRRDARRVLELRGDPAAACCTSARSSIPVDQAGVPTLRRAGAGRARRRGAHARPGPARVPAGAHPRRARGARQPDGGGRAGASRPTRRWKRSCSWNRSSRRCRRRSRRTRASPTAGRSPRRGRRSAAWMFAHGLLAHNPNGGLPPFTNEFLPGQGI